MHWNSHLRKKDMQLLYEFAQSIWELMRPGVFRLYRLLFRRLAFAIPIWIALIVAGGFGIAWYLRTPKVDPELAVSSEERESERIERAFQNALALDSEGKRAEAEKIMRDLAPGDQPGYAAAHQWRLEKDWAELVNLLKKPNKTQSEQDQQSQLYDAVIQQAEQLFAIQPDNPVALEKLTLALLDQGKVARATIYLRTLIRHNPAYNLLYAKLLDKQGQRGAANDALRRAIRYGQEELENWDLAPGDRTQKRIQLASAYAYQGEHSQAIKVLSQGKAFESDANLRSALANAYVTWSDSIVVEGSGSDRQLAEKLSLLEKAASLNSTDPMILFKIAKLTGAPGQEGKLAQATLRQLLSETDESSNLSDFILGVLSMQAGDDKASLKHFERAIVVDPNAPITMNNLAYLLAQGEATELPRALSLISSAIALSPDTNEFYDTRGGILIAMQDWVKAISDLEHALAGDVGDPRTIHERLALAYEKIGDAELASLHRQKALTTLSSPK